mgnify:CR=1 FL=1
MRSTTIDGLGKVASISWMRLWKTGAAMSSLQKSSAGPNALEPMGIGSSHGRIAIFAAPRAVTTHVTWSINDALGRPNELRWEPQPLLPGTWRTSLSWNGLIGTGARLASALRSWHYLHFEIYEASLHGSDGSLYMFTPELGLFRANIGPHGDIMVNEHQLHSVISSHLKESDVCNHIEKLLGAPWNEVLEPFRRIEIDGTEDLIGRISV